jgi:hypothetical protein
MMLSGCCRVQVINPAAGYASGDVKLEGDLITFVNMLNSFEKGA